MTSSHVKISMISLISSLSLKLYLNSLVYHRNIFWSSSKVFGNIRKSSEIFGNSRKVFGNVRLPFGTILENFRKVVGNFRENHHKRRHQHVYIIKGTLHVSPKIWILCSFEHTIHIFPSPCNILYLFYGVLPTVHCSYTQLGKQVKWWIGDTAEVASWPFYNSGKASIRTQLSLGSVKGISEYQ